MDESISAFVKSVRIEHCRVTSTPHLIFLCGGATSNSESGPILSARDYFHRHIKRAGPSGFANRVRLAEQINRWFDEDTFDDLLELEVYLADLSDLTILFVESPGSIAELGAFATSDSLRPRTLAVLNSVHPPDKTFIADGPVRRIRNHDRNLVEYYPWNAEHPDDPANLEVFEDMSQELVKHVLNRAAAAPKEKTLDESLGHTMFLIVDLVDVVGITTGAEIIECLSHWNRRVDKKSLQKYLSLLEHLQLLKRKLYSDQTYYLSASTTGLIRYDFVSGTRVRDRERAKTFIREALAKSDPRRMSVYRRELLGPDRSRRRHV